MRHLQLAIKKWILAVDFRGFLEVIQGFTGFSVQVGAKFENNGDSHGENMENAMGFAI